MAWALYDAGMTGIAHQQTYALWWQGGFRSTPTRHNMVGILTEAASTRLGSPITLSVDSIRQPGRGVNYPAPWAGGTWHLGDIVRYELITSEALVHLAARDRVNVLDRFVGLGRRAVEAGLTGDPFAYVLPIEQRDPESWTALANVLAAGGVEVWRAAEPFTVEGQTYSAGSLVVPMGQPYRAHAKDLLEPQHYTPVNDRPPCDVAGWTLPFTMGVTAARHGFTVTAARTAPAGGVGVSHQRLPRIGLYRPWTGNIDEGWTRWLFEQYGISYTTLLDNDFKKGALRQRFDVIVLPDAEAASILRGIDSTRIPAQYAGGVGEAGANAVSEFVRGGGTLVCLDGSSNFAITRLNLPVVNVLAGEASGPQVLRFYAPGSIFGVVLGGVGVGVGGVPRSAVTLGVPDSFQVYFENSAAFTVSAPARGLATYPAQPLRSGYARFQERLAGKAALVEAPVSS